MKVNFNEIRRLSKAIKSRPILQCIHVKDNKMYWTNTAFLLVSPIKQNDGTYHSDTFEKIPGEYPPVDSIIKSAKQGVKAAWSVEIYLDQVIRVYHKDEPLIASNGDKRQRFLYIDDEIIKVVEKLLTIKLSFDDLIVKGNMLLFEQDDTILIFSGKRGEINVQ